MPGPKVLYTTSEVGRLCRVSLSTVINWVNEGRLKAFETPGGHRRIKREDLSEFLRTYHMPVPLDLGETQAKRILLVDDDRSSLRTLARTIKKHIPDSDIKTAQDTFAAGSKLVSFRPVLVLINVSSREFDGCELCKQIRLLSETREAKIIALSSDKRPAYEKKALACGANEYVLKPVVSAALMERIARMLRNGQDNAPESYQAAG